MNRRVLITGATSGIGEQLAIDYLNDGYEVFACGRSQEKLNQLKMAVGNNEKLELVCFNITSKEDTQQKLSSLDKLFDTVILNAGTCEYMDVVEKDKLTFDAELFERVINVNVIGLANCIDVLINKIKPQGHLSLMSSSAEYLAFTRAQAYGASKAAITHLAQTLSIDLHGKIHVSWISPGFVKTPLTDKNDFAMTMMITTQEASESIRKGIDKNLLEIHFPKKFTYILKLLRFLPFRLWKKISIYLSKSISN